MTFYQLLNLATFVMLVSAGVERIVQILKITPWVTKVFRSRHKEVIQMVSIIVGIIASAVIGGEYIDSLIDNHIVACTVMGLAFSYGSNICHELLRILEACNKVVPSESKADQ